MEWDGLGSGLSMGLLHFDISSGAWEIGMGWGQVASWKMDGWVGG